MYMAHYFSSDPPNISLCEQIGISYKISVKLKFCAQPMHQIYIIKYCILLKTSLSELEWVTRHKCGFHNDSIQVWKKSLPIKILVPFPWQHNLIKKLPIGAISKSMIQTREAIPKYTLLNPVSLIWTWHFKHGIQATNFPSPN